MTAEEEPRLWTRRPCDVTGCTEEAHDYADGTKDGLCISLGIGEGHANEVFWVVGYRDEETGLWGAFCEDPDLGTLQGGQGLAMVEKFALAYRTVQEHCDRLNKLERSTR